MESLTEAFGSLLVFGYHCFFDWIRLHCDPGLSEWIVAARAGSGFLPGRSRGTGGKQGVAEQAYGPPPEMGRSMRRNPVRLAFGLLLGLVGIDTPANTTAIRHACPAQTPNASKPNPTPTASSPRPPQPAGATTPPATTTLTITLGAIVKTQ
jgi:hypothetical protein